MPAVSILSIDPVTGAVGRRASGAPLYRRGSRFGPPERGNLDRNLVARIIFFAEALDRRTRGPRQHGGILKAKGLDVLRALLKRFYSYLTGECFPSYDQIAEAAGCSRSTVAAKLRILEQLGITQTIRRKVVASFTSRAHRVRFDVAVQTSNSYRFNLPITDRSQHGDLGLLLLQPEKARVSAVKEAESKIRAETSKVLESRDVADLTAEKERWIRALLGTDKAG